MNNDDVFDSGFDLRNSERIPFESPLPKDMPKIDKRKANELDSPESIAVHRRVLSMYQRELDRQQINRMEMATDEDFYDAIQWDEQDAATLKERGQQPIVYNVINTSVNWVIGSEKRGRVDFKVLPRRKEESKKKEQPVSVIEQMLNKHTATGDQFVFGKPPVQSNPKADAQCL